MVNEKKLRIAGKAFTFQWLKGKVLEVKSLAKTVGGGQVWVNPNQTATSNISIHSIEQLDIFLEDTAGTEHAFKLDNFNFSCRQGHEITIVKIIRGEGGSGPFIGLYNHNTGENKAKYGLMNQMIRPSSAFSWFLALVLPVVLWLFFLFGIEKLFLAMKVRYSTENLLIYSLFASSIAIPVAWLVVYFGYQRKKNKRQKRMRDAYAQLNL